MYTREQDKIDQDLVIKLLSLTSALENSLNDVFMISTLNGKEFHHFTSLVDGKDIVESRIKNNGEEIRSVLAGNILLEEYLSRTAATHQYGSREEVAKNVTEICNNLFHYLGILIDHWEREGEKSFLYAPSTQYERRTNINIEYSNDPKRTYNFKNFTRTNFNRRRYMKDESSFVYDSFNEKSSLEGFLDEIESLKSMTQDYIGNNNENKIDKKNIFSGYVNRETLEPIFSEVRSTQARHETNYDFILPNSYNKKIGKVEALLNKFNL